MIQRLVEPADVARVRERMLKIMALLDGTQDADPIVESSR
jgi:hypothetical protein